MHFQGLVISSFLSLQSLHIESRGLFHTWIRFPLLRFLFLILATATLAQAYFSGPAWAAKPYKPYALYDAYTSYAPPLPICRRNPSARECNGTEEQCRAYPAWATCNGTRAQCERYNSWPICLGTRAHCESYSTSRECSGTKAYCERLPTTTVCQGTEASCRSNPSHPECLGTPAYCRQYPHSAACQDDGSQDPCQANPWSYECKVAKCKEQDSLYDRECHEIFCRYNPAAESCRR
jgi:hypothetical protein